MSRRCGNCSQWASTDQVWGECVYASAPEDSRTAGRLAVASHVRLGVEQAAELETNYQFGCVAWTSLASALRRVERRAVAAPAGGGR